MTIYAVQVGYVVARSTRSDRYVSDMTCLNELKTIVQSGSHPMVFGCNR